MSIEQAELESALRQTRPIYAQRRNRLRSVPSAPHPSRLTLMLGRHGAESVRHVSRLFERMATALGLVRTAIINAVGQ
jgi:hypothetical protein